MVEVSETSAVPPIKYPARLYERASEIARAFCGWCQPLLWQLRQHHIARGETQTAYELAERLLSFAEAMQDADLLLQAYLALGNTLYYRGEPLPARTYLEQGMALYQPQQDRSHRLAGICNWFTEGFDTLDLREARLLLEAV